MESFRNPYWKDIGLKGVCGGGVPKREVLNLIVVVYI